MADLLTSSKRILAVYRGQKTDRIPIGSPISWSPMRDIKKEKPGGWRADPGFIRVAELVEEYCDPVPQPYNPMPLPCATEISYQRFLEAPAKYIEKCPEKKIGPNRYEQTFILHAPKGELFWTFHRDEGVETNWDMHRPIETPRDVEIMLSVPFYVGQGKPEDYEPFRQYRKEMGKDCLGGGSVNTMVAMLCGVMEYELMLEWILSEPILIQMLADAWLERTWANVDFQLRQGVGPFWHFNGIERASPPMMGPKQWKKYVEPYDGEIMRRIKQRDPEAKIHVHCHGKVKTLLDSFVKMGVDSTDPVEPPDQGDIEFEEAKQFYAGKMTLVGNIEFLWMETLSPDEIEEKVKSAIRLGGKEHTILLPSATPVEAHTAKFLANAERYIKAGLKYGKW